MSAVSPEEKRRAILDEAKLTVELDGRVSTFCSLCGRPSVEKVCGPCLHGSEGSPFPAKAPELAPELPNAAPKEKEWLERTSDLLAEGDPGPTPFLVEDLVVEQAIAMIVGPAKVRKTWIALELAIAIVTGRPALGRFEVGEPGPAILVLEESGRAALHRRLGALSRGSAIEPKLLAELHVAPNRRVRLNSAEWQTKLREAAETIKPRAIILDPLVRLKGAAVDEDRQREMGPVLDYMHDLRNLSGAAVLFVHHSGHEGTRARGSSDLEGYWESKLTVSREDGLGTLEAEHREAEAAGTVRFRFLWDEPTRSVRIVVDEKEAELRAKVAGYLADHPSATANEVYDVIGGRRKAVLAFVRELKESPELLSQETSTRFPSPGNHAEPMPSAPVSHPVPPTPLSPVGGGVREPGRAELVPALGDEGFDEYLLAAVQAGHITDAEACERLDLHRLVERSRAA